MLFVLLAMEAVDDDDNMRIREIVGPFGSREAAQAWRATMTADHFEIRELVVPPAVTVNRNG